jgi:hypothetical protein
MIRFASATALLALSITPASAFTIVGDTMTFNEVVHSYGMTRTDKRASTNVAAIKQNLDRLCASKRKADIKSCDAAWAFIAAKRQEIAARDAAAAQ